METRLLERGELIYWRDSIVEKLNGIRQLLALERNPLKRAMLERLESVVRTPMSFIMNALRHPSVESIQVPKYKLDRYLAYICNQVTLVESNLAAMEAHPDPNQDMTIPRLPWEEVDEDAAD